MKKILAFLLLAGIALHTSAQQQLKSTSNVAAAGFLLKGFSV